MFIIAILSLFILYKIILYLWNEKVSFYSLCFISSFWSFSYVIITFRPDNVMLFLLILSFYFLILMYKKGKQIYLFMAGLVSTFTFFFFPKSISLLLVIYFFGILPDLKNKKPYFSFGIIGGIFFSVIFLILLNISLKNFYLYVFKINFFYPWHSEIMTFLKRYWKNFLLCIIFGSIGIYSIIKKQKSIIYFFPILALLNFTFYIIFIVGSRNLSQYWIPFYPFASILSAIGIVETIDFVKKGLNNKFIIESGFIIIFLWLSIRINMFPLISYDRISQSYISQINYMLENIFPNDRILIYFGPDGEFKHPI
ncbi:MAG TPA: glycosyltransferase family 39 protein, partial [Candidatus Ratteibacteria bacterium]|nr:glycosyltransferase family 39 protein [Candidatus Ratteibacteria bacterium]